MAETLKKWTIPGEVMYRIVYDVAGSVPPAKSVLVYTDEMIEFRTKVTAEWLAWKEAHPDAELHAPEDLPSSNIPFDGAE